MKLVYIFQNYQLENECKFVTEKLKKLEQNCEVMVTNELRAKCKEVDLLKQRLDEALDSR